MMKYPYVDDGMCEVCHDGTFAYESGMVRCEKHMTKEQKRFYSQFKKEGARMKDVIISETYEGQLEHPEVRARYDVTTKFLPGKKTGERILEVGIGSGMIGLNLLAKNRNVVFVEPDEKIIRQFIENAIKKKLPLPKIHNVLYEDYVTYEKYDIILFLGLLEHVESVVACLKKAKKMLAKNGRLFITINNADSIHRVLGCKLGLIKCQNSLSLAEREHGHKRVLTRFELEKCLSKTGFGVVVKEGFYFKPLPTRYLSGLSREAHDKLNYLGGFFPDQAGYLLFVCEVGK